MEIIKNRYISPHPPQRRDLKRKKSRVQPDQSLSIQEIVKRYVRGIPVDVVQRQGVYIDQSEHDLEKLSRMDFGEKAELAEALRLQAEQTKSDLAESARLRKEEQRQAEEQKAAQAKAEKASETSKA